MTQMTEIETSRLLADAAWEMEQVLGEWKCPLELDITTLLAVAGGLQLALRHPGAKRRPSGKVLRQLVDELIAAIPESAPATKRVAYMGDEPEYDSRLSGLRRD